MNVKLSIQEIVNLARAAFTAGAYAWDQMESPEPPEPTDGQLLGIAVDCLGGCEAFAGMNRAQRITAAAIPDEIAGVLEDLRNGAVLSIGDELRGCELSEAFSALVFDLLSDQIEQGDEAGGVQV